MTDTKPGYATTEMWLTLAHLLLAALVTVGVVTATDAHTLEGAVGAGITAAAALLSSAVTVVGYVRGRTELKIEAAQPPEVKP